jgi:hypothetical protein
VPNSAPYTSKELITVDTVSVNNGAIAATGLDTVHAVGYLGDASGDGFVNAFDNSLIQRVILGQSTGFPAYKDLDPLFVADVSGDGFLNAFDNAVIQRYILLQNPPQIPPIPQGVTPTPGGPDPLVYLPKGLVVKPGGAVDVPVNFLQTAGRPIDLGSFDLAIAYDPSVFAVAGVNPGGLAAGSRFFWSTDPSAGLIYVSAARPSGPVTLPAGDSGALAVITLVARPDATPGARAINLLNSVYDAGGNRATRLEDGHLTLSPAPTNGANDPVDGLVVVAGPRAVQPGRGVSASPAPVAPASVSGATDQALEALWAPAARANGLSTRPAVATPSSLVKVTGRVRPSDLAAQSLHRPAAVPWVAPARPRSVR